jgi:hypothetical protein
VRRFLLFLVVGGAVVFLGFFFSRFAKQDSPGGPRFAGAAVGDATTPDRLFTGPSGEVITVPGQVYTPSVVTETVTVTATAPTTTAPPPGALLDNKSADLNTLNLSWPNIENAHSGDGFDPRIVTDYTTTGRKVYVLTTTPQDTGVPSTAQRVDLADWNTYQHDPSKASQGLKRFYEAEVYFPSSGPLGSYRPTGGEWNWFYQWHYNNTISVSGWPVELAMGVATDSATRANPRMFIDIRGGNVDGCSSYRCSSVTTSRYTAPSNSLQLDHWYDLVFEINWSHGSDGYMKLWVDGMLKIDQTASVPVPGWTPYRLPSSGGYVVKTAESEQPNLYWRAGTNFTDMLYPAESNYHAAADPIGSVNWNSTILFRDWKSAASAADLGFTP